jgi:ER membrane protein SH3
VPQERDPAEHLALADPRVVPEGRADALGKLLVVRHPTSVTAGTDARDNGEVNAFVAAGAGFLVAVLWFDLMFDVQALRSAGDELPEPVLASIAAYYRRVTTTARPMNRLIAAVMLVTVAAVVAEIVRADVPAWAGWGSLALAAAPIALAATRTVPSAVRLGARGDSAARQSALARSVGRQHLVCLASIAGLLVLQLAAV